ncbi:MAG: bifunctional class I SAM-dependent methyltransferase/glycosyltransferase family 2 protein [Ignavibacteria bacterium]|nr:bifunctional class I SAM-dependent methyltransferase/glycosyltransferase family 2 protein [Ignavibacteria bacterium]
MDLIPESRDNWIRKNKYYYDNLIAFLKFNIPEKSKIIEIGCGTGFLLGNLNPERAVGIDSSEGMIDKAKENFPEYEFHIMNAENISLEEKFDYIIISDTIGYFKDVQKVFNQIQKLCHSETRIIITYINFLWLPILNLAEHLKLKMPQQRNNWLDIKDINNLLLLSNFDVIKSGRKLLMPVYIPLISEIINKFFSNLPLLNKLCLNGFIIARSSDIKESLDTVSVVIPARNEKGNIEEIVERVPMMGKHTEIIFIEGNSTDDTFNEIKRVCEKYSVNKDLKYAKQPGKGKADAVRMGFEMASGKILMILDADMTVPPEDLPKFYEAISSGKGEFLNGSRLVYPMEDEAMQTLNIMGNKFFSIMFSWILNQRIKDTLCGTKVISKNNYGKLKLTKKFLGDFDPFGDFDLIFGASKINLKFAEIPIRYRARVYGETNISRFRHGWMLLKMTFYAMRKFKFT